MRAFVVGSLFGVIVLSTMGLSAASSISAATDGLTSESLLADARPGQAFSGQAFSSQSPRVPDDPDAPVRTGRWVEDMPPVMLAGGPPGQTVAEAVARPVQTASLASTTLPALPAARPAVILTPPSPTRMALRSFSRQPATGEPRVNLTVSIDRDGVAPGSGLDPDDRFTGEGFATPRLARPSPVQEARRLLMRIGPSQDAGGKGRWFIFAAGSGKAYGLNLVRDPGRGLRNAGWSVERLAEFGKAQLGVGWRKGRRQVALSAARREIGAYGVSREDTVVGVTFTVSGQKPSKREFKGGIRKQ